MKYHRIWWAFPQNGGSTENDAVMSLSLATMTWDPLLPMHVSAFGQYKAGTTYTIDTIPFSTIDGIAWSTIDSFENVAGWLFDICGDYAGLSYQSMADFVYDAGAAYQSMIHLGTDMTMDQALAYYKRVHGFWVWFKRHPLTDYQATVSIQTENDDAPVLAATIDLATGSGHGNIIRQWCPYDCRSRDFIIEVAAAQDFSWYGILFEFDLDGTR